MATNICGMKNQLKQMVKPPVTTPENNKVNLGNIIHPSKNIHPCISQYSACNHSIIWNISPLRIVCKRPSTAPYPDSKTSLAMQTEQTRSSSSKMIEIVISLSFL